MISMNGNKKNYVWGRAKSPMYVCGCIYIVRKETRLLIHILMYGYVSQGIGYNIFCNEENGLMKPGTKTRLHIKTTHMYIHTLSKGTKQ